MTEWWQQLLAIILAPAFAVGVVSYFAKKVIENNSEKKLEKYKSELNTKFEQYKKDLELANKKNSFRYAEIFNKQKDVIYDLHKRLIDLRADISLYITLDGVGVVGKMESDLSSLDKNKLYSAMLQISPNHLQEILTQTQQLQKDCLYSSIYFNKGLADKIQSIINILISKSATGFFSRSSIKGSVKNVIEELKKIDGNLDEAISDIEAEFRALFGILQKEETK